MRERLAPLQRLDHPRQREENGAGRENVLAMLLEITVVTKAAEIQPIR